MKRISIIIPTFNRGQYIRRTITSFVEQSFPTNEFEIIIMDNNSTDNTAEIVAEFVDENPNIKYFKEIRQGVHYARNSAIQFAEADILYYTDDDMVADPHLLTNILYPFSIDEHIATVGGRILPIWESTPPKWVLQYCLNSLLSLNNDESTLLISNELLNVFSCHQAVKKKLLIEAGGYNPENTAGEWIGDGETGLSLALKKNGYKHAYIGKSLIYHIIPKTRMTQTYLNKRFANQGNCDSYTAFRATDGSLELLRTDKASNIKMMLITFGRAIWQIIRFNSYWRLTLAKVFYHYNRIKYNNKLLQDKNWRKFVLKTNWIED